MAGDSDERSLTFLDDRTAVIERTMDLIDDADEECLGMGRQVAWIDLPRVGDKERTFSRIVEDAVVNRDVDVRVLASNEGKVRVFAEEFSDTGARVRYVGDEDYGDIRVAIADSEEAVIAFPADATETKTRRAYKGVYVEDAEFCELLADRFDVFWRAGYRPTYNSVVDALREFRNDRTAVYASVVSWFAAMVASTITIFTFVT